MLTAPKYIISLCFPIVVACAAPSEPAGLQSSAAGQSAGTAVKVKAQAAAVDYGGAAVGDAAMQATVKSCLDSGKFYDRTSTPQPKCTTMALAEMNCKDATVKDIMTPEQKSQYQEFLTTKLAGYLVDQCLKCDSPAGNSFCEGKGDVKKTDPGTRLYLVKEADGVINIQSVYIHK